MGLDGGHPHDCPRLRRKIRRRAHDHHRVHARRLHRGHVQQRVATLADADRLELTNAKTIEQREGILRDPPMGQQAGRIRRAAVAANVGVMNRLPSARSWPMNCQSSPRPVSRAETAGHAFARLFVEQRAAVDVRFSSLLRCLPRAEIMLPDRRAPVAAKTINWKNEGEPTRVG